MDKFARWAAAAMGLGLAGCASLQPVLDSFQRASLQAQGTALLVCDGDFGQFANGYIVSRPMQLQFAVYWGVPAIYPMNGGSPAKILALNSLELSFDVEYEGYSAAYHLDRVDGTFVQRPNLGRPNLGGVYFGRCYAQPLSTNV
jgi:hypothetical protein